MAVIPSLEYLSMRLKDGYDPSKGISGDCPSAIASDMAFSIADVLMSFPRHKPVEAIQPIPVMSAVLIVMAFPG
jgi:hypothetical protein